VRRAILTCTLILLFAGGCGRSDSGPALSDLPSYPGATQTESMEQSGMLGILGGELVQLTTGDSYDEVLDFYTTELAGRDTEVIEHTTELGRQTAISITRDEGVITVAIQEFTDEDAVNITHMRVGRP